MTLKPSTKKGLNPAMHLLPQAFDSTHTKYVPTRDGYGEGLVQAGTIDKNVVVLCADLSESTRSLPFKQTFPDRFIQMGVSEQSMASIAAGMALTGKVPFISSYATFSPGRNWEQIRTTIALNNTNVKIAGAHAGISVGPDGATHQMIEDIAIMRVMPNMRVLVPCDKEETRKATLTAAKLVGPYYLRFAREKSPVFTTEKTPFTLGHAETYRFGNDLTIVAAGPVLYEALLAAETLSHKYRIEARVINCHTIKPFDVQTIVLAAKETGAFVTIEEAQAVGGLGGAVAETLTLTIPVPLERMGIQDRFGESGEPRELMEGFGLTASFIIQAARRVLKRKKGERVPALPEYIAAARKKLECMQKNVMKKALNQTPKKWGGKKPDSTLKSRTSV
ncbi:MAG: hypothetical protein UU31_C0005G0016 [Candidatus Uhrbacteria bacterium GW2011_GWA2_41_10]|uniref:Transketolase-like pyrimidine-binding domain-containing protein n=1 Tax=Candidatus Uhrbacteria bacterium GW2011_GWC2_41_11 TaxID=1618985 RepID=A0A0G0UB74_9BACT|nr:MAG: hypothetical protein UU31_C0005G0016 [Candidatus Uhrbacteria bacterium GW2011_GWA2_41_10]KKR86224.1 MAG: hypothetical protein UU35_C0017G0020 [Candidatus Uhrbacteria bacterium GW2011_GWC2_41_11]